MAEWGGAGKLKAPNRHLEAGPELMFVVKPELTASTARGPVS
jgi:hypothetical protein